MSLPQEHNYIALSEALPDSILSPSTSTGSSEIGKNYVLNLKETELRLGLPGSVSPERRSGAGVSPFWKDELSHNSLKSFASGAKRGFSDTINGSNKWGLSINGGSKVDLGKSDVPRGNSAAKGNNSVDEKKNETTNTAPASKAQVVGWPPVRSFRKSNPPTNSAKNNNELAEKQGSGSLYVKVSMDGAPYLRKIDLKMYRSYTELSSGLEKMFSCFTIGQCGEGVEGKERLMDLANGSEYVLTYEDKDGDWMLVGDVLWEMFTNSCKRLRIMKGSDAIGLGPRSMNK